MFERLTHRNKYGIAYTKIAVNESNMVMLENAIQEELMNDGLREIAIRTDSGDAWENPFSHEDVAQAISTIRYINRKDLTENTYDLLTALEALHRQQPMSVKLKHKEGEDAALITCPVCWHSTITNFKLHKQFYPEWYCKHCGQRLFWGDEP